MRNTVRLLVVAVAAAAVAIACGSGDGSQFVDPNANGDGGGTPPGSFELTDGSASDGQTSCKPRSCADQNANCGSAGDGCGGTIASCGTCGIGDSCGGGGKPSLCGHPACVPKTCAAQSINCGLAGDGCGGQIDCGGCDGGTCGGGGVPSNCGGSGGDGGTCVPTKVGCAVGDCGFVADGCGGGFSCPTTCPVGQTCGGGPRPGVCGAPPCTKATCGAQNCGFIADGCGGPAISCWPGAAVCPPGMSCGGAGTANTCGTPASCTGLCLQQQGCVGGGTTSIEGYVTSPNGLLPVPNAVVYVPNGAVTAFTANVQCETCATASGSPLVSTTTDANGHFLLPNMPVSTAGKVVDIPVVVQLGRWRKQLTIATTACTNNLVPKFADAATTIAAADNGWGLGGTVTAATNAAPIVITSSPNHGLATGAVVTISGALGNTAANGTFTITGVSASRFSLNGSTGNGAYTSGGAWSLSVITVASTAGFPATGTFSITSSAGTQLVTYTGLTPTTFTGCTGGTGTLSTGAAVVHRTAANKNAALPTAQTEGDIPLTAISTGSVDGLECVLRKMGVADSEFTHATGTGRIRLYQDPGDGAGNGGACAGGCGTGCNTAGSATCPRADVLYCPAGAKGAGACGTAGGAGAPNEIDKFDAVIFGCVGGESNKGTSARDNVVAYANKGGRVFATHFSYVWLYSTAAPAFVSPWAATADAWNPGRASWNNTTPPGSMSAIVDTSFAKGLLFSTWLQAPVAPVSASYAPPYSAVNGLYVVPSASSPAIIALTEPRKDIEPGVANLATSGIIAPAQRWIYSTNDNGVACVTGATCKSGVCTASKCVGSQVFPYPDVGNACNRDRDCASGSCTGGKCDGDPAAQDAPLHYTFNTDTTKPAAQQCGRVLYSDFHVSTGASTQDKVFPAECDANPLTSQEKVLAYMIFDLASCVSSSTPPACVPKDCPTQGLGCGLAGDGCGNLINCGACPAGQTCGGGGVPSQCGAPACTAGVCVAGNCGKKGDGCGGTLDCGLCAAGTCGGGGAGICGGGTCTPTGCPTPAPGSACGPVANGCGAVNNCPCAAGVPCVNGTCGAPACVPRDCATAGANCGTVADGCGGTIACGACIAPQTCGGGGTANLCGGGVN